MGGPSASRHPCQGPSRSRPAASCCPRGCRRGWGPVPWSGWPGCGRPRPGGSPAPPGSPAQPATPVSGVRGRLKDGAGPPAAAATRGREALGECRGRRAWEARWAERGRGQRGGGPLVVAAFRFHGQAGRSGGAATSGAATVLQQPRSRGQPHSPGHAAAGPGEHVPGGQAANHEQPHPRDTATSTTGGCRAASWRATFAESEYPHTGLGDVGAPRRCSAAGRTRDSGENVVAFSTISATRCTASLTAWPTDHDPGLQLDEFHSYWAMAALRAAVRREAGFGRGSARLAAGSRRGRSRAPLEPAPRVVVPR